MDVKLGSLTAIGSSRLLVQNIHLRNAQLQCCAVNTLLSIEALQSAHAQGSRKGLRTRADIRWQCLGPDGSAPLANGYPKPSTPLDELLSGMAIVPAGPPAAPQPQPSPSAAYAAVSRVVQVKELGSSSPSCALAVAILTWLTIGHWFLAKGDGNQRC